MRSPAVDTSIDTAINTEATLIGTAPTGAILPAPAGLACGHLMGGAASGYAATSARTTDIGPATIARTTDLDTAIIGRSTDIGTAATEHERQTIALRLALRYAIAG